jgi:hypothetical protein
MDDARLRLRLRSTGWLCRNQVVLARCFQHVLDEVDLPHQRLHAQALTTRFLQDFTSSSQSQLANMLVPNCKRAALVAAQRQTLLNQLRVACGLERYSRQHGRYPERLSELIPDFLDAVPKDLFADAPLQYRRTPDGGYQLWSVGWEERDHHGLAGPLDPDGRHQFTEQGADWVWQRPPP